LSGAEERTGVDSRKKENAGNPEEGSKKVRPRGGKTKKRGSKKKGATPRKKGGNAQGGRAGNPKGHGKPGCVIIPEGGGGEEGVGERLIPKK